MSQLQWSSPVIHTPSFKEYSISASELRNKLQSLEAKILYGMLDSNYYFTDLDGWIKVLYDLVFKSSLYKIDKFDCENYALKAMNECHERYGLNTLAMVIGDMPQGRHGFNMLYYGDSFLLWEPNEGFPFSGSPFEIGDFGYFPRFVLI